jgi:hypothetical protein
VSLDAYLDVLDEAGHVVVSQGEVVLYRQGQSAST